MRAEIDKFSIKLKHVDIQNHWLHQEYQWDHIIIYYVESKNMIINRLTKALLLNSHHWFLDQMNLIDIQDHLQNHQTDEAAATFESLKLMNIDWILHELSVSEFHEKFWIWMRFYSQFWCEFSELNQALLPWFWFYSILFWSNLTSAAISSLNLHFEFCKKLLNLVRILQSNLGWFFYIEEGFSERFWFYLILFWSNLAGISTSFFDFMIYLRFLLSWENNQKMIKVWRSFHYFNSQSRNFYWCWLNRLLVFWYFVHSDWFILIYFIDFVDFHWYFEAGRLTIPANLRRCVAFTQ